MTALRVAFLGAAQEVTGSMHLVETPAGSILIDCGLYQGRRAESRERNRSLPGAAYRADAVILTHAHIDHSGNLPTLVKNGYRGRIFTTPATRDLCDAMLRDSARIQEGDAEYLNRKHAADPDFEPIEPLYTEDDAARALERFEGCPYDQAFEPLAGVTARLIDAGHILGSAQLLLDVPDGAGGKRRLLFSGDLGRRGLPILRDPADPGPADHVFMESTYGGRIHGSVAQMEDDLAAIVARAVEKKGRVIIPAFAVGRTQEIVYSLRQLHSAGRIPDIPVFIDSPLAMKATQVFATHPECYDAETLEFIQHNGSPFSFKTVRYVESREESMRLNDLSGPAIIIAASGMCEAGRVLHHLKHGVSDARNTIVIVGFQAQHTLGRRLVEGRPRVRIFGLEHELYAKVVVLNGFSAHADQRDLVAYAHRQRSARSLHLIHGEIEAQEQLRQLLSTDGIDAQIPARGDIVDL